MNDSFDRFWETICQNHPEFNKDETEAVKLRIRGLKLLAKLAWQDGLDVANSIREYREKLQKTANGSYKGLDIFSQMFGTKK